MSDQPPPPQHRNPPTPQPAAQRWPPPHQRSMPPTPVAPAPPKQHRARGIIIGALVLSAAVGLVALSSILRDPAPEPSREAKLAAVFADRLPVDTDAEMAAAVEAVTPLADAVCKMAWVADDSEAMSFALAASWFSEEDSLSNVFESSDSFFLFAATALDWRCPSQAQRLGVAP